jgi:hypothetical protein
MMEICLCIGLIVIGVIANICGALVTAFFGGSNTPAGRAIATCLVRHTFTCGLAHSSVLAILSTLGVWLLFTDVSSAVYAVICLNFMFGLFTTGQ